ncbi:MAG: lipopolysaccharide heptosyltransferase III, heptosyltransferase III [Deltaproteobacteria bacterium CSP1-8]|jgi:heptosyltransferase-3|nr:MAG: lipopolysaccharide heptosyltransferase III, heptosyltransferase III [Deltaproteobacteria bacterium CSP1-8]OGP79956.1 MAG: putative lipopolysaccharide heptosyltransferase III [Deltaproteobacteria bacterium RBG_16_64_85]
MIDFHDILRILVIKLRHIGDVLLTAPVFRALRETFPGARICALVHSGTQDVLEGNPDIDEVLVFDRGVKNLPFPRQVVREGKFARGIRERGFDLAIDLTGGDRAAILSYLSGARYRIGWRDRKGFAGKRWMYTNLHSPDQNCHMVAQNLSVVRSVGITTRNAAVTFPVSAKDRERAKEILREYSGNGRIVHVHPTSRWMFKCWKDEYVAEVIRRLVDRGVTVLLTTSPAPREVERGGRIKVLLGDAPGVVDLRGRVTLRQLGALSEISDLFLGVDSAPMHIAAAVGTPVVALFGPSGVHNWGPWDNESAREAGESLRMPYARRRGNQVFGIHTAVQRDWDCVPCGESGCESTKWCRCLDDILPEEIFPLVAGKLGLGEG